MQKIYPWANYTMTKYGMLFSNTTELFNQTLFVIGNGYHIDTLSGMPYDEEQKLLIHQFPENKASDYFSQAKNIISAKVKNNSTWRDVYDYNKDYSLTFEEFEQSKIDEQISECKLVSVTDNQFTENHFYQSLKDSSANKTRYVRPYPLSVDYSDIFKLNKNTPDEFREIAHGFCRAWIRFLSEEIDSNHCGKDYDTMEYTTLHRDMLKGIV